jgi:formimidoylglutamate deiminase
MLAAGRRADLVVLDGNDVDLEALDAPGALAVATFSGNANRVRDVFVAGEPVVIEGRHPREEQARDAYRATLARLRLLPPG